MLPYTPSRLGQMTIKDPNESAGANWLVAESNEASDILPTAQENPTSSLRGANNENSMTIQQRSSTEALPIHLGGFANQNIYHLPQTNTTGRNGEHEMAGEQNMHIPGQSHPSLDCRNNFSNAVGQPEYQNSLQDFGQALNRVKAHTAGQNEGQITHGIRVGTPVAAMNINSAFMQDGTSHAQQNPLQKMNNSDTSTGADLRQTQPGGAMRYSPSAHPHNTSQVWSGVSTPPIAAFSGYQQTTENSNRRPTNYQTVPQQTPTGVFRNASQQGYRDPTQQSMLPQDYNLIDRQPQVYAPQQPFQHGYQSMTSNQHLQVMPQTTLQRESFSGSAGMPTYSQDSQHLGYGYHTREDTQTYSPVTNNFGQGNSSFDPSRAPRSQTQTGHETGFGRGRFESPGHVANGTRRLLKPTLFRPPSARRSEHTKARDRFQSPEKKRSHTSGVMKTISKTPHLERPPNSRLYLVHELAIMAGFHREMGETPVSSQKELLGWFKKVSIREDQSALWKQYYENNACDKEKEDRRKADVAHEAAWAAFHRETRSGQTRRWKAMQQSPAFKDQKEATLESWGLTPEERRHNWRHYN